MEITSSNDRAGRGAPPEHSARTLLRLYRYMTQWRGLFAGILVLLMVSLACELVMPLVIESAVNAINFTGGLTVDFQSLLVSVGLLAAVTLVSCAAGWGQERISAQITLGMSKRLRQDAVDSLLRTSVSTFEGKRRGDLMSRVTNDSELAAGAFCDTFKELISCIIVVVGCAVIMLSKCASVAAVSIGAAIVSVAITGALSRVVYPAFVAQQAALGKMNAHVEESLKTIRTCKAAGRGAENGRRMQQLSRECYTARLRACRLEFMMGPVMLLLGNLSFLLTVVFGAGQIISGAITIGAMQAFILYSKQFMEPLNSLGEYFVRAQNAIAGAERVFAVMDDRGERREIDAARPAVMLPADAPGKLSFRQVAFAYHRNHPVLKGLDLSLQKGERLALVGRTGAGKTTLTNLLLLFYPGYKGSISYDGKDIRDLDPEQLRGMITVVSQDPQIVEGTVFDNMAYGCKGVTREDACRVVEELGIAEMIHRLPQEMDTPMRNVGENLSQGQLQLICMVRAVLRRSEILILDEATSSLDPDTERMVRQGMEAAMAGRTCIIIAHRLSSVQDADHIAVLSEGGIVEYGTHEELMQKDGVYRMLYQTQYLGRET